MKIRILFSTVFWISLLLLCKQAISQPMATHATRQGEITLHSLLTNTPGLPHHEATPSYFSPNQYYGSTKEEYMTLFWDKELLWKPDLDRKYTSLGCFVVGVILEKIMALPVVIGPDRHS